MERALDVNPRPFSYRNNFFAMGGGSVSGVVEAADIGEISAVARSGTVAVSKGEVTLTSFDRQYLHVG